MSYYVIVNKNDITEEMVKSNGYKNSAYNIITRENETETDYALIKIKDRASTLFSGHIKFTAMEVVSAIAKIKEDRYVDILTSGKNKQKLWKDTQGFSRDFQKLWEFEENTDTTITWIADKNYVWGGLRYNISGAEHGDYALIEVYDPVLQKILSTRIDWYLYDGSHMEDASEYFTEIPEGVHLRLQFKKGIGNTGTTSGLFNGRIYSKG